MREIEILISFLPSLLIFLYFMHQLNPFIAIIYSLIILAAIDLSVLLSSKLFSIEIDFTRWVDGIVFSVVITGFLSAIGAPLPVFLLPVAQIERSFSLKRPNQKLSSYDVFRFAVILAIITLLVLIVLSMLTLFIGGYSLSSRIVGGFLISFFISYLPFSQKLIGVRLLYARPNGYLFEEIILLLSAIIAYFSMEAVGILLAIDLLFVVILIERKLL